MPPPANNRRKVDSYDEGISPSLYNTSSTQTDIPIISSNTQASPMQASIEKDTGMDITSNRIDATDMSVVDIDTELRLKSLNLRIKGQIQTIKTLESQLQESLAVIEIRNKQLKQEQNRTAMLEKKLSLAQSLGRSSHENGSNSSAHVKNAEQLASKYKVDHILLFNMLQLIVVSSRLKLMSYHRSCWKSKRRGSD
jgi:uncharacterized coiled-coil protein SlyX